MSATAEFDLSIIVPVYNVAQYLSDCLDSLVKQKFTGKYQIILVNDCSPDNSGRICAEYAKLFPEKVILISHESNHGSAVARNTGLNAMNSDFFVFVDPDDIVPPGSLLTLFKEIKSSSADIVKGNNTILKKNANAPANYNVKREHLIQNENCLTTLLSHKYVRGHPWGKIYRTATLGGIRFTPGYRMAQDLLYCIEAFSECTSLKLIPEVVYCYRLHTMGATGKKYQTDAYQWWFRAVDDAKNFTKSSQQKAAHLNLKVRTLLQAIKEIRKLDDDTRKLLLEKIESQKDDWSISFKSIIQTRNSSLETLVRYFKYCRTRRKIVNNK